MGMPPKRPRRAAPASGNAAFTLMELLFGAMAFALIMVVLHSLFFGVLDLRERTQQMLRTTMPEHQAIRLIKQDLQGLMVTRSQLAPSFELTTAGSMGVNAEQFSFYTTSGSLNPTSRWPDVHRVAYYLSSQEQFENSPPPSKGQGLMRATVQNLLASSTASATARRLLSNVRSLRFHFFDNGNWLETWETSTLPTNMPQAIRVQIEFMPGRTSSPPRKSIEIVAPVTIEPPQSDGNQDRDNDSDENPESDDQDADDSARNGERNGRDQAERER